MEKLVSIITPVYNGEKYIEMAIKSVINQTYKNWEMIIVDDISNDQTITLVDNYSKLDKRIHYFILDEKGGASMARNKAIRSAKGEYIAFLDADDVWLKDKLKLQIEFMEKNNCYFTYHNYLLINEESKYLDIMRTSPKVLSYKRALMGCSIGCLTVIYNAKEVGLIQIPRIDKRNDDALWFEILSRCKYGYLIDQTLALYRVTDKSLSSGSKIKLIKYHYYLYRISRKFNPIKSIFYVLINISVYLLNKKKYEIRVI